MEASSELTFSICSASQSVGYKGFGLTVSFENFINLSYITAVVVAGYIWSFFQPC